MKRKSRDRVVRVKLTKESEFEGVIIDLRCLTFKDKEDSNGCNADAHYKIVKVPKNKYKDMDDSMESVFNTVLQKVFVDIVKKAVNEHIKNKEKHE